MECNKNKLFKNRTLFHLKNSRPRFRIKKNMQDQYVCVHILLSSAFVYLDALKSSCIDVISQFPSNFYKKPAIQADFIQQWTVKD